MPDAVPAPGTACMKDEVERTVRVISVPGGVTEIRSIADNGTHSGYFNDPALLASSSELLDLATVHGVYITLNEVEPALIARRANRVKMRLGAKDTTTSDADILRRRWFPIDIDPVRPSGVSATDEEREMAFGKAVELAAWLAEQGFPEPVRGDSGNGAHLLYRIDLENDEQSKRLIQQCLSVLHLFFSDERCMVDTAVFNAARIWKLYGTVSRKGDHTPDRPHRRSHLLAVPDPIGLVSRDTLEQLAGLLPVTDPGPGGVFGGNLTGSPGPTPGTSPARPGTPTMRTSPSAVSPGPGQGRTKVYQDGNVPLDLRGWFREQGIAIRYEKPWQGGTLFVLEACPFSSAHRDGAFAIQFPSGAIYAGCKHASCGAGKQRWLELRRMFDSEYVEREKEREAAALSGEPETTGNSAKVSGMQSSTVSSDGDPSTGTRGNQDGASPSRSPSPGKPGSPPVSTGADRDSPVRSQASAILASGDPRKFILDTFAKCHVGDGIVAACYLVSILSTMVANSRGLHVCPTGDSGKGKSDSASAFLRLLPDDAKMQGSITSKALFYHGIAPGSAIIFDDFAVSEDLREVLKNATSNFQHGLKHYTLNANRQAMTLELPERCVWWILSVDNPGDDQVLNRMMNPWIDDSEQQDLRVRDHIFARACRSGGAPEENEDVAVCREIFSLVREQAYYVRIPFATRIRMDSIRNRRNPIMFLDIIKSFAALRFQQREQRTLASGMMEIDASREDFHDAARLFSALDSTDGGQTSKLLKNEKLLIDSILAMKTEEFTLKDAQSWMGLSHAMTHRILHGRQDRGREPGGLLAKCPALGMVETTVSEGTIAAVTRRRENHYFFDYDQYMAWNRNNGVWLAPGDDDGDDGEGSDPSVPTVPTNGQDGNRDGNSSDPVKNDPIDNPDNNVPNNSTTKHNCSQKRDRAACAQGSSISQPGPGARGVSACDPGTREHEHETISQTGGNDKISRVSRNNPFPELFPQDTGPGTAGTLREEDYLALPHGSENPCHICGMSPTSSIKVPRLTDPPGEGDKYLCFACLKQARERERAAKRTSSGTKAGPPPLNISPLPGTLSPGDFTRVKFSLGKCGICRGNEAVFKSASKAINCCEKCYGRLVREGNRAEGAG
jgi:hypothetical protein